MFRRRWSALPKDPVFPSTLEGLGYFVNDDDEIRSIENPAAYFRYRVNHNERVNHRRRFHFNLAVDRIVHQRLQDDEGLEKLALPLGTPTNDPHISIFASPDIESKSQVVLIVGDTQATLGMISGRVATGPGGINRGSAVSLVRAIKQHLPDASIVIANPGELIWWPEGGRAVTIREAEAVPRSSAVSLGKRFDERVNIVPGHETESEHLARVFEFFTERAVQDAKVHIFGVEKGAEAVEVFLDDQDVWKRWGGKLESMVLMNTLREAELLKNEALKSFLGTRCRCYAISDEALDVPIAGPAGNAEERIPALGLPVYSSSEPACSDVIAVTAQTAAVRYFAEVAASDDFENPKVVIVKSEGEGDHADCEQAQKTWEELGEEHKPAIEWVSETVLREQRMWNRWEETGVAEADLQQEGEGTKDTGQQP